MAVAQRAYASDAGPAWGGPPAWRTRYWSITIWLIVVNCAIFLADVLCGQWLTRVASLSLDDLRRGWVWQLLTFQFLHAGAWHLIFNMLWLYFLGRIIEPRLGKRQFLIFYLASGVGSGAVFTLFAALRIAGVDSATTIVGASGSIFGVMAAAVCVAPRLPICVWLVPVSIPLWIVFAGAIAMAIVSIRTGGWNAGGEAAHIGGAVTGFLLFKNAAWLRVLSTGRRRSRFWRPGDPPESFFRNG